MPVWWSSLSLWGVVFQSGRSVRGHRLRVCACWACHPEGVDLSAEVVAQPLVKWQVSFGKEE